MCGMIWLFFSRGMDFKKKLLNSLTSCLKVNWGQITRYSIICYSKLTFRNPFIYMCDEIGSPYSLPLYQ